MSPWISIWTRPKETIRNIVMANPNRSLWLLAAIYGFSSLLNIFQSAGLGANLGVMPIVLFAVILSPIWGYAMFALWSWIVLVTGKIFRGRGEYQTVRAAYSWSCVPLVFNVAFWFILIALFGRDLFFAIGEDRLTQLEVTTLFVILIAKVVLAIWSLVIYLNTLAEVQHFSVLRSIGNVILAGIVLCLGFTLLWMLSMKLLGTGLSFETTKAAIHIFQDAAAIGEKL